MKNKDFINIAFLIGEIYINLWVYSIMDSTPGFGPGNGGSNPLRPIHKI